jgi:two-component system, NarL family, nitrate/nitrite response regulator NarL
VATRTRIYLVDDHPVYRDGLARAIKERPELELTGQSGSGRQALEEIGTLLPDVALVDVRMPDLDGNDVLRALQRDGVPTRVILLSAELEGELVYRAIAMGAAAYVSKAADRDTIIDVIGRVVRGGTYVPPELMNGLAAQIRLREREERPALTGREREVLRMTADGRSAPRIAAELHLSTATVKTHLQSLYEKLGVRDRAAAVATAMRLGLLE